MAEPPIVSLNDNQFQDQSNRGSASSHRALLGDLCRGKKAIIYYPGNAWASNNAFTDNKWGMTKLKEEWSGGIVDTSITKDFPTVADNLQILYLAPASFDITQPQVEIVKELLADGGHVIVNYGKFGSSLLKAIGSVMKFEDAGRDNGTYTINIDETAHAHPFLDGISSTEDKFCGYKSDTVTSRRGSGTQSLAEIGGKSVVMTEPVGGGFVLAVADKFMLNNHAGVYWPSVHIPSCTKDYVDSQHLWWFNIANTACENPTITCLRATKDIHKRVWMALSDSTIHPTVTAKKFLWIFDKKEDQLAEFSSTAGYDGACTKEGGKVEIMEGNIACGETSYEVTGFPSCRWINCAEETTVFAEQFKLNMIAATKLKEGVQCKVTVSGALSASVGIAIGSMLAVVWHLM